MSKNEKTFDKLSSVFERNIFELSESKNDENEIIDRLKEKFIKTKGRFLKMKVLTVLPKSWSITKIQSIFTASNRMARTAKKFISEDRFLTSNVSKSCKTLAPEVIDHIIDFYKNDNNSRMMPGGRDCKSVKTQEGKLPKQKRLVLCNLKELYKLLKDTYPNIKVGFSKFFGV